MVICYINDASRDIAMDIYRKLGADAGNAQVLEFRHVVSEWCRDEIVVVIDPQYENSIPQSQICEVFVTAKMIIHCVPSQDEIVETGNYNRIGVQDYTSEKVVDALQNEFRENLNRK
jgi:hypothetical protein